MITKNNSDKRIVFFDNVKTGSTSIRKILQDTGHFNIDTKHTKLVDSNYPFLNSDRDSKLVLSKEEYQKIKRQHTRITKLSFIEKEEYLYNYFKVSTIRNPYDRLFSLFRMRLRQNKSRVKSLHLTLSPEGFEKFLLTVQKDMNFEKENTRSLVDNISSVDIIEQKENINFLIRFENFEEDIKSCFEKLEIKIDKIPNLKKSKSFDYRDFYTDVSKEIVENLHKKDLEMYGYKF